METGDFAEIPSVSSAVIRTGRDVEKRKEKGGNMSGKRVEVDEQPEHETSSARANRIQHHVHRVACARPGALRRTAGICSGDL